MQQSNGALVSRADELEAEAHEKIAEGHALLARARRERAPTTVPPANDWIRPETSPLGKRRTLALCRAGALESSKVGRKVLVKRASLEAFLARHERGIEAREEEDLFGAGAA